MQISHKSDTDIFVSDLRALSEAVGLPHNISADTQVPIMQGNWTYQSWRDGLSVHCVDATELRDISNASELPAGISFNLIFDGEIEFSLSGQRCRMSGSADRGVLCSAIVLAEPEILTRYLRQHVHVHKMNLFVTQAWLEAHCATQQAADEVAALFRCHAGVFRWQATPVLVDRAAQFMHNSPQEASLTSCLTFEQAAIGLLGTLLDELHDCVGEPGEHTADVRMNGDESRKLKQRIDDSLRRCRTLEEIAASLGISSSTLQRRFKATCGMTVIEYVRQRRLEIARYALAVQGVSIGEAAYLAGYKHPSNFVTAFKKRFAVTPAQLVKSHRRL